LRHVLPLYQAMSEKEYNECVTQHADGVYRFIVKNLRHEADAQDVVQTSFEKLWINRSEIDNNKSKAYLFTVAYNQMIDHIRKTKRITLTDTIQEQAKVTATETNQLKKALNEALNKLNETQRSLVMLKDYEGYSYAEIGEIMDLNESQVKVYLHRARLLLRDYIVKMENVI
jgi:RNA polymerase sigma factor (sigma-70 family)